MDASMLSWMLLCPLPAFFLTYIICLYHPWDVRPYALSWVFLFSGPFVEVPSKMVPSIFRWRQPRCLSLWWDFYSIVWFRVVPSFSWEIHFLFFSSSPLVWCCPLSIFPSICKFLLLRTFWSFFALVVLFLPLCVVTPINMAHFSKPNSIKMSWLYILTAWD